MGVNYCHGGPEIQFISILHPPPRPKQNKDVKEKENKLFLYLPPPPIFQRNVGGESEMLGLP